MNEYDGNHDIDLYHGRSWEVSHFQHRKVLIMMGILTMLGGYQANSLGIWWINIGDYNEPVSEWPSCTKIWGWNLQIFPNQSTYGAVILADKYRLTRLILVSNSAHIARILARNVEELNKTRALRLKCPKSWETKCDSDHSRKRDGDNLLHLEKVSIGRLCPWANMFCTLGLTWWKAGICTGLTWEGIFDGIFIKWPMQSRFWSRKIPVPVPIHQKKGWLMIIIQEKFIIQVLLSSICFSLDHDFFVDWQLHKLAPM